jgi:Tfp pilus assembly protein PilF
MTKGVMPMRSHWCKRSLAIREKALGPNHPDVATSLNNMGLLYERQGQYAEAEPLYKRALFTNQPLPVLLPRTSKA